MKKVKRIALVAAAAIVSLTVNAQDALVATLQHGDNMQAFYGGNALKQALEAAQTGDVISLSPGTFNATDITKAVTIQGAGYVQDPANNRYCTTIKGTIKIKLPANEKGLVIEGINMDSSIGNYTVELKGEAENVTFKKCLIYGVSMSDSGNGVSKNWTFDHCRIRLFSPDKKSQNLLLQNCIVSHIYHNSEEASLLINHCIVLCIGYANDGSLTATFKNSLIHGSAEQWTSVNHITSASFIYYNVIAGYSLDRNGDNNIFLNSNDNFKALFADGEYTYTNDRTYELTAEAAQQYLGDDGTQVGIYGGDTPFSDVPTNPQITSRQIATKTDNDGRLSVKITVEAQK